MQAQGLSVRSLSFGFPSYGGPTARGLLHGLEYELPAGGLGVVLGGADAGKTTLARILAGLIPRFTGGDLQGSASYNGLNLFSGKPYELMERVGIVLQNSDEQLITTRCDTETAFALESLGIPRPELRRRVESALELFGLLPFRTRNPATLSGGEKKRLLLACCAAVDPDLWILDEAMEELDAQWRTLLLEHLRSGGKTVLFMDSRWSEVYHDHAPRASLLKDGRLHGFSGSREALREEGFILGPGYAAHAAAASPVPAGPAPRAVLSVRGLSFRFPGEDSFQLEVQDLELHGGEVCSLLGRNGSGKTTLGRLLCGLLPPRAGSIRLDAEGAAGEPLSRRVGYMFQNPDYQIFLPTVYDELSYGLKTAGAGQEEMERRTTEAIGLFHLPPPESPPALMSYGARKRLQAATYHLLRRDFLILDEIDSGLSYSEFLPLLTALRTGGAGIVIITHDVELARAVSDRIIVMDSGRIKTRLMRPDFRGLQG